MDKILWKKRRHKYRSYSNKLLGGKEYKKRLYKKDLKVLFLSAFSAYSFVSYFDLFLKNFFGFYNVIVSYIVLAVVLLPFYLLFLFFEDLRSETPRYTKYIENWSNLFLKHSIGVKIVFLYSYWLMFFLYAWALTILVENILGNTAFYAYSIAGGVWGGFVASSVWSLQRFFDKEKWSFHAFPILRNFVFILYGIAIAFFLNVLFSNLFK